MRHLKKWFFNPTPAKILIVLTMLVIMAAAIIMFVQPAKAERPWMIPEEPPVIVFNEHCCSCDDCDQNSIGVVEQVDRAESEISREKMITEVEMLWNMYFDDDNAKATDPRRDDFEEFAGYLADAVIMYQNEPTDIGGQFPGHKNDHLVVAYMAAKESSVTPDIINDSEGGKGEVCLFQLHGTALAGFDSEKVRHNPRLCTLLGTRWIAAQIPKCKQDGVNIFKDDMNVFRFKWEDADWIGPLSVYAGGPKAIRKDGRCARFGKMRERVDAVRLFRTRIDYEMDFREE